MARFFRGVAMVGAIVSDLGSLYIGVKVFMLIHPITAHFEQ
jgi:hypothetical protein